MIFVDLVLLLFLYIFSVPPFLKTHFLHFFFVNMWLLSSSIPLLGKKKNVIINIWIISELAGYTPGFLKTNATYTHTFSLDVKLPTTETSKSPCHFISILCQHTSPRCSRIRFRARERETVKWREETRQWRERERDRKRREERRKIWGRVDDRD